MYNVSMKRRLSTLETVSQKVQYGSITLFVCLVVVITGLAVLENYTDSEILWFRWEKQDWVFEENTALPYIKWNCDGWEVYQAYMALEAGKRRRQQKLRGRCPVIRESGSVPEN